VAAIRACSWPVRTWSGLLRTKGAGAHHNGGRLAGAVLSPSTVAGAAVACAHARDAHRGGFIWVLTTQLTREWFLACGQTAGCAAHRCAAGGRAVC